MDGPEDVKHNIQVMQSFSVLQPVPPNVGQPPSGQQSEPQNLSTGTQTSVLAGNQWQIQGGGNQQIIYQNTGNTSAVTQTEKLHHAVSQPSTSDNRQHDNKGNKEIKQQRSNTDHTPSSQQNQTNTPISNSTMAITNALSALSDTQHMSLQPLEHSIWAELQTTEMNTNMNEEEEIEMKPKIKKEIKKKRKLADLLAEGIDPTKLEENSDQVRDRFSKGCECDGENCFKNMNPEFVFRHRLNIAELTKSEHDMYLMGVTMACLANPEETSRHKERKRLRASYVFQGKKICLDAFLYLENCTHYQLKAIRKHVMVNGVTPRIHGNHGKKPPNTFPLDTYQHAAAFLQSYISRHNPNGVGSKKGAKTNSKPPSCYLPVEITRKKIHNAYREYCEHFEPDVKVMGYSSFRHFMKEQFPNVKFFRMDRKYDKSGGGGGGNSDDSDSDTPLQTGPESGKTVMHLVNAAPVEEQQQQQPLNPQQQQPLNPQQQQRSVPNNPSNHQNVNTSTDPRPNSSNNKDANNTPPTSLPPSSIVVSSTAPISTNHPPTVVCSAPPLSVGPPASVGVAHPSMVANAIPTPGVIYPSYSHVQLPLNLQTQQPLYSACMQPFPQPPPPTQGRPAPFPYTNL